MESNGWYSEIDGVICCTALHLAVQNGHKDVVKYISQLPVKSNEDTLFKLIATSFAAMNGNVDMLRCIFPNNYEDVDDIEETMEEASCSYIESVDDIISNELISAVKNLNEKFMAAKKVKLNYEKIHRALTVKPTDNFQQNVIDEHFGTIFEAAEQGGNMHLERFLEDGTDVNICDANKDTALHLAAAHGNVNNVAFLIENGAQIKAKNKNYNTPFHMSAKFGHVQVVKQFLKTGIFIDIKNSTGCTALHLACENGHVDVAALLLLNKADPNCIDSNGNTPLHCASLNNHAIVVQLLIQTKVNVKNLVDVILQQTAYGSLISEASQLFKGADINIKNNDGNTPLHLAVQNTRKHIAGLLLQQNADVKAVNKNNESIMDSVKDEECLMLILKFISNFEFVDKAGNTLLHRATEFNYSKMADYLLKNKSNIEAVNTNKETPLHVAARKGHCNIMETLLRHGANIEAVNNNKETPLHVAASNGHCNIVDKLLRHGANVDSKDNKNYKSIHIAINNEHYKVVELLLEKGVDVNTLGGGYNHTPLICAALKNNLEIVKLLLAYGANKTIRCSNNRTALQNNSNAQPAILELLTPN